MTNYDIFTKVGGATGLACIVLVFYQAIFPARRKSIGQKEIYDYSAINFSMALMFLLFFVLVGANNMEVLHDWPTATLAIFIFLALLANSAYVFCYKIVIENGKITYGAFEEKSFHVSQIRRADKIFTGRRRYFLVILRYGERLTFSPLLTGYDELSEKIKSEAVKNGFPQNK